MVTLATIGYGDIAAQSENARIAVMVQIVFDVAVIGATVKLISTAARRVAGEREDAGDGVWRGRLR